MNSPGSKKYKLDKSFSTPMILVPPAPIKITLSRSQGVPLDPPTTLAMLLLLLGSKPLAASPITHLLLISLNPKVKIPNSDLSSTLETRKVNLSSPGPELSSLTSLFLPKEPLLEFPTLTFGPPLNTLISQTVPLQEAPFSLILCSPQRPMLLMTTAEVKDAVSFTTLSTRSTSSVSDVMSLPPAMVSSQKMLLFTHTLWDSSTFQMKVRLDTSWQQLQNGTLG